MGLQNRRNLDRKKGFLMIKIRYFAKNRSLHESTPWQASPTSLKATELF